MMDFLTERSLEFVQEHFPACRYSVGAGGAVLYPQPEELLDILGFLKNTASFAFERVINLTAVDEKESFCMVYHLWSGRLRQAVVVKVKLPHEQPSIASLTALWPAVEFEEREVYDLMGICFLQHPALHRIFLPEDFPGHPLRKDFIAPVPEMEGGHLKWKEANPMS